MNGPASASDSRAAKNSALVLRTVPVAACDAGALDPDFANLSAGARLASQRIDNLHLLPADHDARADEGQDIAFRLAGRHSVPLFEQRFGTLNRSTGSPGVRDVTISVDSASP